MMFRNHMDPDYYDPKANDKIFVPDVVDAEALNDQQKGIVKSFPERDRGIFGKDAKSTVPIEEDPLEAAVKKMRIRKDHKLKEKAMKNKTPKENFGIDGEEDSSDKDSAEYFEEEDDEDYEDEGSEYSDDEETKGELTDELKQAKKFKPAEGVKFF